MDCIAKYCKTRSYIAQDGVGANSFVTHDVLAYAIVVGTPAKIMKYRFDETTINSLLQSDYYRYPPKKAKYLIDQLVKDIRYDE